MISPCFQEKGPGETFVPTPIPSATDLGSRCLLVARALSRPNPPSSRTSAAVPDSTTSDDAERLDARTATVTRPGDLTGLLVPASEPGAGLDKKLTADRVDVNSRGPG